MAGIIGFGAYVPEWRISAKEISSVWPAAAKVPGIKTKAVADVDEDVITMGVAAAEQALASAGISAEEVEAVYFASTSAPCDEKSSAALIQTIMAIPSTAVPIDISHSTRAGAVALRTCLSQAESKQIAIGLVIAADNRLAPGGEMLEFSAAAGAVAFVIGSQGVIARINGWSSATSEFTNVWRPYGEKFLRRHDDNRTEREASYQRSIVKAAKGLFNSGQVNAKDLNYLAITEADGKYIQKIAKALGMAEETTKITNIAPNIGDTGVASSLLGLASVLSKGNPGEKCLVISYGSGCGSDAFVVELTEEILAKRQRDLDFDQVIGGNRPVNYTTYAKRNGIIPVAPFLPDPISGYVTQPNAFREAEYVLGLKALKCKKCGSINFPYRHYCIDCRGQEFEEVKLPRRGKLVTYNIQYIMAIGPEEGPLLVGTARLDGADGERGGKVSSCMIDTDLSGARIGMPVELVLRRCGMELGIPKYGYKFKPIVEDSRKGEV